MKGHQKRPGKGLGAFLSSAMELRLDSCLVLHGLGEAFCSHPFLSCQGWLDADGAVGF